ncbi:MAG: hypothetical protein ACR2MP_21115 [Streptosporangiaceae bacterium]
MKVSRIFPAAAASLALVTGLSISAATAAGAATAAPASSGSRLAASAPASTLGTVTSTVTGTFTNAAGTGNFTGKFAPQKFSVVNGTLQATGLLTGTLVDANGTQLGTVSRTVTIPVNTTNAANAPLACGILNLTLGPLNLNLLGLVVTLNQVHLTITAVPGAGNLLGNLLCSLVGLLNGGASLSAISALLTSILALL